MKRIIHLMMPLLATITEYGQNSYDSGEKWLSNAYYSTFGCISAHFGQKEQKKRLGSDLKKSALENKNIACSIQTTQQYLFEDCSDTIQRCGNFVHRARFVFVPRSFSHGYF